MTDYSKSTIYKIACKDPNIEEIYIGSTCNYVKRRWQHKSVCNNPNDKHYNQYVYQFIREHGGWENWDVYIIEQFSCNTKMQKEQVERGWIEELKPTLNKNVPENHQNGDESDISEYTKGYREDNKETINCQDCNRLINLATRSSHKTITILATLKHHQNQIQ